MTENLMQKLERVAHGRRAQFFPESHGRIAVVGFDMGEIEYYAKSERGRYVVYRESRNHPSVQGDFAEVDHAILLIGLLADAGTMHRPDEIINIDDVIRGDPSITDGQLAAIIDRHIDPGFYSLGAAHNPDSVWLRVSPQSHDVMYRDPAGTDGVISSDTVTDAYDMRPNDVAVVCNYAWNLQYAWRRILDWGFAPDDPQLTPILHLVLGVDEPLRS